MKRAVLCTRMEEYGFLTQKLNFPSLIVPGIGSGLLVIIEDPNINQIGQTRSASINYDGEIISYDKWFSICESLKKMNRKAVHCKTQSEWNYLIDRISTKLSHSVFLEHCDSNGLLFILEDPISNNIGKAHTTMSFNGEIISFEKWREEYYFAPAFILPFKWCVKHPGTVDGNIIYEYANAHGCCPPYGTRPQVENTLYYHFPAIAGVTSALNMMSDYTEITFEQFKLHVFDKEFTTIVGPSKNRMYMPKKNSIDAMNKAAMASCVNRFKNMVNNGGMYFAPTGSVQINNSNCINTIDEITNIFLSDDEHKMVEISKIEIVKSINI